MEELTFKDLMLLKEIHIEGDMVVANEVSLINISKIEIENIDEYLTYLRFKNHQEEIVAIISVGSTERLIINNRWSYIKVI